MEIKCLGRKVNLFVIVFSAALCISFLTVVLSPFIILGSAQVADKKPEPAVDKSKSQVEKEKLTINSLMEQALPNFTVNINQERRVHWLDFGPFAVAFVALMIAVFPWAIRCINRPKLQICFYPEKEEYFHKVLFKVLETIHDPLKNIDYFIRQPGKNSRLEKLLGSGLVLQHFL